ncbi:SDR family oxidoreductase [Aquabacter sp. L1I39]|uniref:SDR family NAD(P)-dependent oxidoreductase n=1 Tax=Aquabacter sp. L1I39 TaxID=2820278 RepID=UPI001ADC5B53|nr:SDR family NAD(P)-dependent oxidoreductase [Aquabacter sp. L1I39]QTL03172.1 SDR family oxidoreductase [Aquabacter sp. L1I39]
MGFSVNLEGRTALVTGGSKGLGAFFAERLAQSGARVAVAARNKAECEAVCARIREAGGEAIPLAIDVTRAASVDAAVAEGVETFGRLDILVANAGVTATTPLLDLEEEAWDRILDTNLKGAFLVGRAAARAMASAKTGGTIVTVASILGERIAGQVSAYCASKAGLIQLTRSMALEWARHGIRANALCPGYVETDLNRDFFESEAGKALIRRIPYRRLAKLEDVAGPLLFLCSDASSYMTGSTLEVDGGHLVSSL